MTDFPWLTLLILVPLVGALVVGFVPARRDDELPRTIALGVAAVTLVLAVVMATGYETGGGMQFTEQHEWVGPLGVYYSLGVDGLGLLMVLLTAVLVPIVMLAARPDIEATEGGAHPKTFYAWALALQALSIAVFCATDVFLFYVVFEATLIPAYFLIGGFGGAGRSRAAVKFLIYQLVGGLVMLAAVIGVYVAAAQAGHPTYLLSELGQLEIDPGLQKWLFVGFFIAFAIKAPMFPVHTWLADTTEKATPGTSVLLVCILDKIGTFGMLRFCLGLFPDASQWATPVVVALALVSIIYGAFVAIGQDNVLRLVGLTSLSHFGFIVLGIFVFSADGTSGSILYMVNHGLGTALLFLVAGYLIRRTGTASIREMGGVEKKAPILGGLLLIAGLAACGLPGLAPFVSEMIVLIAAFDYQWYVGAIAVTAIVLAAFYALWMYQRTMTGPDPDVAVDDTGQTRVIRDLTTAEVGVVAPLVAALLFFGFYPAPLLDVINPVADSVMTQLQVEPDHPEVTIDDVEPDHAADQSEGAH